MLPQLGVSLRQSYARVGKLALIKHQRYAHAHQIKRAPTVAYASSRPISAVSSATTLQGPLLLTPERVSS